MGMSLASVCTLGDCHVVEALKVMTDDNNGLHVLILLRPPSSQAPYPVEFYEKKQPRDSVRCNDLLKMRKLFQNK